MTQQLIDEVYDSFKKLPSSLKNSTDYESVNKIREYIEKIYLENNLSNDYYHQCHKTRFILTLSEIPKCKNQNENILEIGSFTYFSLFLNEILGYKNIYGLDRLYNTKEKIIQTTKKLAGRKYSQTVFNIDLDSKNDYETIINSGIKFDKIIFMEVLEHLFRPTLPLIKFREILKQDGELILTTPNSCGISSLNHLLNMRIPMTFSTMCYGNPYMMHVREYTPATLKYMLRSCGYEEKTFNTINAYNADIKEKYYNLYPFINQPEINKKLINDTIISISTPNKEVISEVPDIIYEIGAYSKKEFQKYNISNEYFFETLQGKSTIKNKFLKIYKFLKLLKLYMICIR